MIFRRALITIDEEYPLVPAISPPSNLEEYFKTTKFLKKVDSLASKLLEGDRVAAINDKIFGVLEFEYIWYKDIMVDFYGRDVEINLSISGDELGDFEDAQYDSYTAFMNIWIDLQPKIVQTVLEYYKQKRHDLGYDVEFNGDYPVIESVEQIIEHITLAGIKIPYSSPDNAREVGIAFGCTWDSENGVGLRLVNEEIVDIGYQDVAI